jgi:hypothetical protein
VLLREIRERGYTGGISQLKVWLVPLKKIASDDGQAHPAQVQISPRSTGRCRRVGAQAG